MANFWLPPESPIVRAMRGWPSSPNKKPTVAYEIDWSNPLTRGLRHLYAPDLNDVFDLVDQKQWSLVGNAVMGADVNGRYWEATTTVTRGSFYRDLTEAERFSATQVSFMHVGRWRIDGDIVSWRYAPGIRTNSANDRNHLLGITSYNLDGAWTLINSDYESSYTVTAPSGQVNNALKSCVGTLDTANNRVACAVNGRYSENTPTTLTSGTVYRIGTVRQETWCGCPVYLFGVWDRSLSKAEMEEVSRNPYQLLKPANDTPYLVAAAAAAASTSYFLPARSKIARALRGWPSSPNKKPTVAYEIDWSNPITRGLQFAWTGGLHDLVSGAVGEYVGSNRTVYDAQHGAVWDCEPSSNSSRIKIQTSLPSYPTASTDFTFLGLFTSPDMTVSSASKLLGLTADDGSWPGCCMFYHSFGSNSVEARVDSNYWGDYNSGFVTTSAGWNIAIATFDHLAASVQQCRITLDNGNTNVNGANTATGNTNANPYFTSDSSNTSLNSCKTGLYYFWTRKLSTAEQERLFKDPYCFLKPANDTPYLMALAQQAAAASSYFLPAQSKIARAMRGWPTAQDWLPILSGGIRLDMAHPALAGYDLQYAAVATPDGMLDLKSNTIVPISATSGSGTPTFYKGGICNQGGNGIGWDTGLTAIPSTEETTMFIFTINNAGSTYDGLVSCDRFSDDGAEYIALPEGLEIGLNNTTNVCRIGLQRGQGWGSNLPVVTHQPFLLIASGGTVNPGIGALRHWRVPISFKLNLSVAPWYAANHSRYFGIGLNTETTEVILYAVVKWHKKIPDGMLLDIARDPSQLFAANDTPYLVATSGGAAPPGPQNVPVTLAAETDTAQALASLKKRVLNTSTETGAAQAFGKLKNLAIAIAAETELALPITRQSAPIAVGQSLETDVAQSLSRLKRLAIGNATSTEVAQELNAIKRIAMTHGAENDVAQGFAKLKRLALSSVTDSQAAQAFTALKRMALTAATETDLAQAIITFAITLSAGTMVSIGDTYATPQVYVTR